MSKKTISIEYCPKCGWMLRAAYMAQELLTTFVEEIGGVTLIPSVVSGRFIISEGDSILFDRKRDGQFPEIKALKRVVRDLVAPGKNLGHTDHKKNE